MLAGMAAERTLADVSRSPSARSFWRERVASVAAPQPVHDYFIDEANLRGYWGAFRASTPERPIDATLELEDIVVGLLAPQAPAEARIFKLVLRILQSGRLSARKLLHRARRERAVTTLYWLLRRVPEEERTPAIAELSEVFSAAPRGYRELAFRFEPSRLIRRVATKEDFWRGVRGEPPAR
jgi:hypothetical protein